MDAILTMVPWQGLGWGGLIFIAVLALIRGDIVSRKVHDEVKSDRDMWRDTSLKLLAQNSKLLSVGDLTVASFKAIENAGRVPVSEADPDHEGG